MRAKKVLLIVLIAGGVAAGGYLFFRGGAPPATKVPPGVPPSATERGPFGGRVSLREVKAYIEGLRERPIRNPFLSSRDLEWDRFLEKLKLPRVEGVVRIGAERLAAIEGKWLKVGDRVKGFVLTKVEDRGVTLRRGKATYFVPVEERR